MAAFDAGAVVATNVVKAFGQHDVKLMVADAAITPRDVVKFDTAQSLVIRQVVGGKDSIGVADLNYAAAQADNNTLTTDFADGDVVDVILSGFVLAVADDTVTRGALQQTGLTVGHEVQDYADTAAATSDTYLTATAESIKDELGEIIGRAISSAAANAVFILHLWGH